MPIRLKSSYISNLGRGTCHCLCAGLCACCPTRVLDGLWQDPGCARPSVPGCHPGWLCATERWNSAWLEYKCCLLCSTTPLYRTPINSSGLNFSLDAQMQRGWQGFMGHVGPDWTFFTAQTTPERSERWIFVLILALRHSAMIMGSSKEISNS